MDLGYPMDRPYRPIPPDLEAPAARIATFLGDGGRAVIVTGPVRSGKRALLDGLLAGMPGRVTRIENRTGLPLSLDGILGQMGQSLVGETDERGLFFRTLAEQAYDDYSAVVAVEDGHTLSSFALAALARVPGLGGPDLPGMILVLSGEESLLGKLDGPGLEQLRNCRRTLMVSLPGPAQAGGLLPLESSLVASVPDALLPDVLPGRPARAVGWSVGPLGLRAVVVALLSGAIAAAGGLAWSLLPHHSAVPVPLPVPASIEAFVPEGVPAQLAPEAPAMQEAAPIAIAPPPSTEAADAATAAVPAAAEPAPAAAAADAPAPDPALAQAQLRREFDAFLDRAGRDTAKLTPAARESLFREYRQWRARTEARPGG